MRMDSVPPLVVTPAASSGALNKDSTCARYVSRAQCLKKAPICRSKLDTKNSDVPSELSIQGH